MLGLGKRCPKCGENKVNAVKESFLADLRRSTFNVMFPIRLLTSSGRKPKNLNVCKSCGFSWEDR